MPRNLRTRHQQRQTATSRGNELDLLVVVPFEGVSQTRADEARLRSDRKSHTRWKTWLRAHKRKPNGASRKRAVHTYTRINPSLGLRYASDKEDAGCRRTFPRREQPKRGADGTRQERERKKERLSRTRARAKRGKLLHARTRLLHRHCTGPLLRTLLEFVEFRGYENRELTSCSEECYVTSRRIADEISVCRTEPYPILSFVQAWLPST